MHTSLFYFTTIKWNLWMCSLPYFTLLLLKWNYNKANYSVLLRQYYENEISGYAQYALLLHYY